MLPQTSTTSTTQSKPFASTTQTQAQPTTLQDRAMLAALNIKAWSARKFDKKTTNDIHAQRNAASDSGRYNKALLPAKAFAKLTAAASAARKDFYTRTLPWTDEGNRILPSANYFDAMEAFRKHNIEFNSAADDFATHYPNLITQARATLGDLYSEADYPSPTQIRERFRMQFNVLPLPSHDDFRTSLPQTEIEAIQSNIKTLYEEAIKNGKRDVYQRIRDVTAHMVDRLTQYTPATDDTSARHPFRDSIVTNIQDLLDLLPALNIDNDPSLSHLTRQLAQLTSEPPRTLREYPAVREDTVLTAQGILDKVNQFLA